MPDDKAFGTLDPNAPITRADFERALRYLNLSDLDQRELLLKLAAQVVALTDELTRRLDGLEPAPAKPGTPATPSPLTMQQQVDEASRHLEVQIRAADEANTNRLWIEVDDENKYDVRGPDIPCGELLALCKARCCQMNFALSTADLDEGVIRWDYGQPYKIRQRASDRFCVHNDPVSHGCTVHAQRPMVCRKYDCRNDKRVWIDYEQRIPAPIDAEGDEKEFDLHERAQQRAVAVFTETHAVKEAYPDQTPTVGPAPNPDNPG